MPIMPNRMRVTRRAACELDDREKTNFLSKWDELKEHIEQGGYDKGTIEEGPKSCFDRAGWRVRAVVDRDLPPPPRDGNRRIPNALHVYEPGSDTPIKSREELRDKLWPSQPQPPSKSADARRVAEGVRLYKGRTPLPCMLSDPCSAQRADAIQTVDATAARVAGRTAADAVSASRMLTFDEQRDGDEQARADSNKVALARAPHTLDKEKARADKEEVALWRRTVELGNAKEAFRNAQKRADRGMTLATDAELALAAETARADEAVELADWAVMRANDAEAAAEHREAELAACMEGLREASEGRREAEARLLRHQQRERRQAKASALALDKAEKRASEAEKRATEAEARATEAAAALAPVARLKRKLDENTQLLEGIPSHGGVAGPSSQRPRMMLRTAEAAASPRRIEREDVDDDEPVYRSVCAAEMEAA